MKHIEVAQFQVTQGEMQSFTSAMQTWERLALNDEDGPEQHTVLVQDDNPCKVVAVTQFADSERAAAFKAKGLAEKMLAHVTPHCETAPVVEVYSLFYAAGPDGPNTIFGQQTHPG